LEVPEDINRKTPIMDILKREMSRNSIIEAASSSGKRPSPRHAVKARPAPQGGRIGVFRHSYALVDHVGDAFGGSASPPPPRGLFRDVTPVP
jgi:hypothetical protein